MPSILSGSFNEKSNIIPSKPIIEEGGFITTLITVKSKEMDNRIYLTLYLLIVKIKR